MSIELNLIRCSDLFISEDYPRAHPEMSDIKDLAESISTNGSIINPIIVFRNADQKFILLKGSRRLLATKSLNIDEIPALIISDISDDQAIEYMASLHLSPKPLTPLEIAKRIKNFQAVANLNNKEISSVIGWGNNDAGRIKVGSYLRINKFPNEAAELFSGPNPLSITAALQLQRLLPYPDYLVWLAQKIVSDSLSVAETHEIISTVEKHFGDSEAITTGQYQIPPVEKTLLDKLKSNFRLMHGVPVTFRQLSDGSISLTIKVPDEKRLMSLLENFELSQ